MKRITALILAAAMIALTLAGCFEQSAFSAAPARLDLPDTGDVRMPFFASDNGYFYRRILLSRRPTSRVPTPHMTPSWNGSVRLRQ